MERLMHVIPDSSYEEQAREYIEEHTDNPQLELEFENN